MKLNYKLKLIRYHRSFVAWCFKLWSYICFNVLLLRCL